MASKRRSVNSFSPGLLIFAVILLSNPIVNIFDYFPDFIACFIISSTLGFFAERAPYFEEAKKDFLKLGYLSLLRIPSFIIMVRITSQNMREGDIRVLLTFVFAVIETYLAIKAISNIFQAMSYLGQRSDAASLITVFRVSGRSVMTPE